MEFKYLVPGHITVTQTAEKKTIRTNSNIHPLGDFKARSPGVDCLGSLLPCFEVKICANGAWQIVDREFGLGHLGV